MLAASEGAYIEEDFIMNLLETVLHYMLQTEVVIKALKRRHPCACTALARPPRYARPVGDAVYTLRSLRDEIRPFPIAAGAERYLRSLRQLSAFWPQHPEAILVPAHDPDA